MTFASRPPGSSRRARRTVLTIAALSGALLVTACSPSSSGSTDAGSDGKVTLTVWSWRVEDEAAYNKIFQAYEKSHPKVNVEFKAFKATEYNKILATGLAGSNGPDVPQVRSYGQLQGTVASKSLLPLDGKVDLSGWDENVVASAKGKEDGKTYSVPLARQTVQMFYNQGLFDKHGLKAPTTWAEFIAANDKLMGAGVTPIAVGAKDDWTLPIVHEVLAGARFGGKAFQSEVLSGKKSFTDPDWVASVKVVGDLAKYMPKNVTGVAQTDAQTLFSAEKAAMIPGGSFDLSVLQKANPAMKIGIFQVPPAPGSPSGSAATTAGWADGNFAVSAKSKHPSRGHGARHVDDLQGVRPDGQRRHQADLGRAGCRPQRPAAQADERQLQELRLARTCCSPTSATGPPRAASCSARACRSCCSAPRTPLR